MTKKKMRRNTRDRRGEKKKKSAERGTSNQVGNV